MTTRALCASALLLSLVLPLEAEARTRRARNVILFLADAGGVPVLNAASLHGYGAPLKLQVQTWPHVGLSETSPVDGFVTDSANPKD